LERDVAIGTETLALFIRSWLTMTPPLPADAQASAQVKGRERYENFVEALGRRLAEGQSLLDEVSADVRAPSGPGTQPPAFDKTAVAPADETGHKQTSRT
jgi:hypothetical protein